MKIKKQTELKIQCGSKSNVGVPKPIEGKNKLGWKGMIALAVLGYFVITGIVPLIFLAFGVIDNFELHTSLSDIVMIICDIFTVLWCWYLIKLNKTVKIKFHIEKKLFYKVLIFIAAFIVATTLLETSGSGLFDKQLGISESELSQKAMMHSGNPFIAFIMVVIAGPLAEEFLFRGVIFGGFRQRYNFWIAAIISSLGFAILHGDLWIGINTFIAGIFLAMLYEKTGSLLPSVLCHSLNNLLAYFVEDTGDMGFVLNIVLLIIAIGILGYVFYKVYTEKTDDNCSSFIH